MNSNSIDPIQVLPDEMLDQCLSLLPPSSIAHSSAINTTWRQFIFSHSNLHNEADLSHLGFAYYKSWREKHNSSDGSPLENFLNTFHHISITPTLNHLKTLSINSSIIWKEYESQDREGGSNTALEHFAGTIVDSEKTLRELNFFLDHYHSTNVPSHLRKCPWDPLKFLSTLIKRLGHFDSKSFRCLKSIWIQAPVYFSIKAGGAECSKSFTLVPTMPMCQGTWRDPEINIVKLMDFATLFVGKGGGLTGFRIQAGYPTGFGSHSMNEIIKALKTSTATLQDLYFCPVEGVESSDLWELASSCPRLVSFVSDYYDYEYEGNFPDRLNKDSLKDLGCICSLKYTNWSRIRDWIGGHLEKFSLTAEAETERDELQLSSPCSPLSIILDSRESLKALKLVLHPFLATHQELRVPLTFPNLESLSLDVGHEIGKWFSKLDLPNLHILYLKTQTFKFYESKDDASCFYPLLENHASKFTNLTFHDSIRAGRKLSFTEVPKLSFSKLTHLDLGQCWESHKTWFSGFLYPNLCSFSKSRDSAPFWPRVFEDEAMENQVQWEQKDDSNLWERCKRT